MIPQDATIVPGDVILTSGLGGNYPADIVIGQVVNVRKFETDLFQTATVQLIVDLTGECSPGDLPISKLRISLR